MVAKITIIFTIVFGIFGAIYGFIVYYELLNLDKSQSKASIDRRTNLGKGICALTSLSSLIIYLLSAPQLVSFVVGFFQILITRVTDIVNDCLDHMKTQNNSYQ